MRQQPLTRKQHLGAQRCVGKTLLFDQKKGHYNHFHVFITAPSFFKRKTERVNGSVKGTEKGVKKGEVEGRDK